MTAPSFEGETACVPRALDAPVLDRPLVKRAAAVGTPVGEGVDPPSVAHQHDGGRADGHGHRLALDQLGDRDGVGPSGRRSLERGRVDADAHGVGEVAPQPGRHADDPEAGQGEPWARAVEDSRAGVLAPRQPGRRDDAETGHVEGEMGQPHAPFSPAGVAPIRDPGRRGRDAAEQTEPDQGARGRLLPTGQVEHHGTGERADRDGDQGRVQGMARPRHRQQVLHPARGDPGGRPDRLGRRVEHGGPLDRVVERSTSRERTALSDMGAPYPAIGGREPVRRQRAAPAPARILAIAPRRCLRAGPGRS